MSELEAALLSYQKTLIRCMEDDLIGYEKANAAFLATQRKKTEPIQAASKSEPVDLGDPDLSGFDDSAASAAVHPIQATVENVQNNLSHNRPNMEFNSNTHSSGGFTVDLGNNTNTPRPPSSSRSRQKKNSGRLIKRAVAYSVTLAIVTALFYRFSLEIYLKDLLLMLQKTIL